MYESTKVAEAIKTTSKMRGIQLKDMLTDLQLNKNTLSNMYNGSMLKADSLARIADYLDCSVDYLLGRKISLGTEDNGNLTLPLSSNKVSSLKELYEVASQLPEEKILDVLEYAQFKRQAREQPRESNNTRRE